MFVEVAFPFTDVRSFYLDQGGRLDLPRWPTPRIKEPNQPADFVRGIGYVDKRPRGGVTGRAGEDKLCHARNAIRFPDLDSHFSIFFRRFFADGDMFARLSVGLRTNLLDIATTVPPQRPLDEALTKVMAIPARVGPLKSGFPERALIFAGADLGRYVQYRTTIQTPGAMKIDGRVICDWGKLPLRVYSEAPIIIVEASRLELSEAIGQTASPDNYSRLFGSTSPIVSLLSLDRGPLPNGLLDVAAWMAKTTDGGQIRCFLLVYENPSLSSVYSTPTIRALRIYLLRLVVERQNIRRLFEWLNKKEIRDNNTELDEDAIERAFTDADKTLRRLEAMPVIGTELVQHLAGDYVEDVQPGESESLRIAIERTFKRRTVRAKAHEFLERDREITQVNQFFLPGSTGVGKMSGDDFRGANISAGAVGSHAKADHTKFENVTQQSAAGDMVLAADLTKLVAAMRAEAKTPEQEIAAEQVEKAADAAKQGKGGHVVAYLKAAGSWALGMAEKIGVEVAKAAISKALGMP
jgi:hypothetical protein